jgi:putative tryptophan/tyrosine transport system substrate-binding protein
MRHRFVGLMLTGALAISIATLPGNAQTSKPLARIGYLSANVAPAAPSFEAFRQGLQELGWIEGQNITLEWRSAAGQDDLLPDLLAELLQRKVDVIVAGGPQATRAAKQATSTTPVIMVGGDPDPVAAGLIASLARPGGNLTGVSIAPPELLRGKQLELLKEAVPRISRVAVLWDSSVNTADLWSAIQEAAGSLAVQIQRLDVADVDGLEGAFRASQGMAAEALLIMESPLFTLHRARIAQLALDNRLPSMGLFRGLADAGCLMTYGPSEAGLVRRAAVYVDKILKGARPGDLPVEQPTWFELVVNLKTAQALGLTIPPTLLFQADEVIQ